MAPVVFDGGGAVVFAGEDDGLGGEDVGRGEDVCLEEDVEDVLGVDREEVDGVREDGGSGVW